MKTVREHPWIISVVLFLFVFLAIANYFLNGPLLASILLFTLYFVLQFVDYDVLLVKYGTVRCPCCGKEKISPPPGEYQCASCNAVFRVRKDQSVQRLNVFTYSVEYVD